MGSTLAWTRNVPRLAVALAVVAGVSALGATRKFYADDPIGRIVDSQDASGVKERDINLIYDTIENSVAWPGDHTPDESGACHANESRRRRERAQGGAGTIQGGADSA